MYLRKDSLKWISKTKRDGLGGHLLSFMTSISIAFQNDSLFNLLTIPCWVIYGKRLQMISRMRLMWLLTIVLDLSLQNLAKDVLCLGVEVRLRQSYKVFLVLNKKSFISHRDYAFCLQLRLRVMDLIRSSFSVNDGMNDEVSPST